MEGPTLYLYRKKTLHNTAYLSWDLLKDWTVQFSSPMSMSFLCKLCNCFFQVCRNSWTGSVSAQSSWLKMGFDRNMFPFDLNVFGVASLKLPTSEKALYKETATVLLALQNTIIELYQPIKKAQECSQSSNWHRICRLQSLQDIFKKRTKVVCRTTAEPSALTPKF